MKNCVKILCFIVFSFIVSSCELENTDFEEYRLIYEEGEEFPMGNFSILDEGRNAYKRPISLLSGDEETDFFLGQTLFKTSWVPFPASTTGLDGLGPTFNAKSCLKCHDRNGRGMPTSLKNPNFVGILLKISIPGITPITGSPLAVPSYGAQLQVFSILGTPREAKVKITYELISGEYPDGTIYSIQKPTYTIFNTYFGALPTNTMMSPRIGNSLIGLGFIDGLSDKEILKNEDIFDRDNDGISGKANYVWNNATKRKELGRFGWKSSQPTLEHQIASASHDDIGLTNPIFPNNNCPSPQSDCALVLIDTDLEIPRVKLDQLTMFESAVGVPIRRNFKDENVLKGKKLFHELKCIVCHKTGFKVENSKVLPQINGTTINPYSDFLLHDMGEGLSDNRPHFRATGNEWRTAPLWGIGMQEKVNGHTFFLHDGRARNLEEAIIWHGGEALKSKNDFMSLAKVERKQVLAFLKSL